jgi:hypothetical protein
VTTAKAFLSRPVSHAFASKFAEAWAACFAAMTRCDLSVMTPQHAIVASKTGVITGASVALLAAVPFLRGSRSASLWATGFFTVVADLLVHPSHFGPHWAEAAVTGIGAMVLAVVLEKTTGWTPSEEP